MLPLFTVSFFKKYFSARDDVNCFNHSMSSKMEKRFIKKNCVRKLCCTCPCSFKDKLTATERKMTEKEWKTDWVQF